MLNSTYHNVTSFHDFKAIPHSQNLTKVNLEWAESHVWKDIGKYEEPEVVVELTQLAHRKEAVVHFIVVACVVWVLAIIGESALWIGEQHVIDVVLIPSVNDCEHHAQDHSNRSKGHSSHECMTEWVSLGVNIRGKEIGQTHTCFSNGYQYPKSICKMSILSCMVKSISLCEIQICDEILNNVWQVNLRACETHLLRVKPVVYDHDERQPRRFSCCSTMEIY